MSNAIRLFVLFAITRTYVYTYAQKHTFHESRPFVLLVHFRDSVHICLPRHFRAVFHAHRYGFV